MFSPKLSQISFLFPHVFPHLSTAFPALPPKPLPSDVQRDASPAHADAELVQFRGDLLGDVAGSRGFGIDGDVHVPAGWGLEKVAELTRVYGRYNEAVYEVNGGFVMVYNHKMGPPVMFVGL